MPEIDQSYEKTAAAMDKAKFVLAKFARDFFPYLILILNIAVAVGTKIFSTEFQNPFTADFIISLIINQTTTIWAYCTFLSHADLNTRQSTSYQAACQKWSELSAKARGYMERFAMYCKEQTAAEREEIRHAIIANNTMITLKRYDDEFKGLSVRQIKHLEKSGVLSKTEAKYIRKANGVHKVRPINPLLILVGTRRRHANDVGRKKMSLGVRSVLLRPAFCIIFSAVFTMISGKFTGVENASVILDMIWSAIMIVMSSVMGYSAGRSSALERKDTILGRALFLEQFLSTV